MNGLKQAVLQIWRLAYPYFTTRDETEVRIWPFGQFRVQERWVALSLAIVVVAIEFGQVAINVRLYYFSRDWFNAIQNKDEAAFWSLLFTVFLLLGGGLHRQRHLPSIASSRLSCASAGGAG